MKNYHFLRNIFFFKKKEEDKNHFLHSLNGSKHLQQDDRCQDDVGLCLLFLKNFLGRNLCRKFDLSNSTSRHDGRTWKLKRSTVLKGAGSNSAEIPLSIESLKILDNGVDGPRSSKYY